MKKDRNDILDFQREGGAMERVLEGVQNAEKIHPMSTEPTALPDELFEHLPEPLRTAATHFSLPHERDIFLISALPVLSGAMIDVQGKHRDGWSYLSLYCGIVAPAGSGKGVMRYARQLAERIDHELYEGSSAKLAAWKQDKGEDKGPEPRERTFFLAGNSSARAMIDSLRNNNGNGVICESEFLTLSTATGQDWGNYRDTLLKAFHQETITLDRKGEKIRIEAPRLAVAITGTPDSFAQFFPTLEDGLFSRFLFYISTGLDSWQSQRPSDDFNEREEFFDDAAERGWILYRLLEGRKTSIQVEWTADQWDRHDRAFQELYDDCSEGLLKASIKRNGVAAFRLGCLLAVLRIAESDPESLRKIERIEVSDQDVGTALTLALHLYNHSVALASDLASRNIWAKSNPKQSRFFSELRSQHPDGFKTKNAIKIGEELNIGSRTVEKWLGDSRLYGVEKTAHGTYRFSDQDNAGRNPEAIAEDAESAVLREAIPPKPQSAQTAPSVIGTKSAAEPVQSNAFKEFLKKLTGKRA